MTRSLPGLLILLVLSAGPSSGQISALEIMTHADQLMRGDTQQGSYEMTIIRPDWSRTTRFEFWSSGTEKSFIRVLGPARDRGVTFLKIGREMWNYIPRVNRVIKLPPSLMLQSWMGSDFTNDDLVRESSVIDDYEHRLLREEEVDGAMAWVIEMLPKPEAPVAWTRIVEWIRQEDYLPARAEYFDERGDLIRSMLFSEITQMDDRRLPARMELIEEKKEGRSTVLVLSDVLFDRPINETIFSQQNLRRGN